jgi:hypothetical protein
VGKGVLRKPQIKYDAKYYSKSLCRQSKVKYLSVVLAALAQIILFVKKKMLRFINLLLLFQKNIGKMRRKSFGMFYYYFLSEISSKFINYSIDMC